MLQVLEDFWASAVAQGHGQPNSLSSGSAEGERRSQPPTPFFNPPAPSYSYAPPIPYSAPTLYGAGQPSGTGMADVPLGCTNEAGQHPKGSHAQATAAGMASLELPTSLPTSPSSGRWPSSSGYQAGLASAGQLLKSGGRREAGAGTWAGSATADSIEPAGAAGLGATPGMTPPRGLNSGAEGVTISAWGAEPVHAVHSSEGAAAVSAPAAAGSAGRPQQEGGSRASEEDGLEDIEDLLELLRI
jgi:hypothetical protein